jgi:hypothetical protein
MPLPLAPLPAVEADAPPLVLPLAGVLADGTLLYLLGGLDVVGGFSTNEVSVVRKVASTSGGAVCVGMLRSWWCLELGEEKFLARAKDCGVGAWEPASVQGLAEVLKQRSYLREVHAESAHVESVEEASEALVEAVQALI